MAMKNSVPMAARSFPGPGKPFSKFSDFHADEAPLANIKMERKGGKKCLSIWESLKPSMLPR